MTNKRRLPLSARFHADSSGFTPWGKRRKASALGMAGTTSA